MTDADFKALEARLSRIEAALTQQQAGATAHIPGGAVVDPAPWPGGGWGWNPWHPFPWPFPHPIVDSATFARRPGIGPIADPAASQFRTAALGQEMLGRIGHTGDPPPIDVSRFSISQLEATLHSINAEKARLASMETMINQQLQKLKTHG
jgi:hypothetical protein